MRALDPRIHDEFQGKSGLTQGTIGEAHHGLPGQARQ
jgi:hypothetical protein